MIVAQDNFEAHTVGVALETLTDWDAFYQSGSGNIVIRTDGPGGSKSAKSEAGLWNWGEFNPAAANIVNQIVSCRMKSTTGRVVLTVRTVGHHATGAKFPSTGYICQFLGGTDLVQIERMNGGNSVTVLASTTAVPGFGADDVIKFQIQGPNMKAFVNGVSVLTAIDSTHTVAGKPGFGGLSSTGVSWVDDFKVESFGGGAALMQRRRRRG